MILSSNNQENNVLSADTIKFLLKLHKTIENITIVSSGLSYGDLCLKEPEKSECATKSLLQIWNYDELKIEQLTDKAVLEKVTETLANKSLGALEEIDSILSGVEYDQDSNQVKKAKGLMNIWFLKQNGTKEEGKKPIDEIAMAWEKIFIDKIIKDSKV